MNNKILEQQSFLFDIEDKTKEYKVKLIPYKDTKDLILNVHYAKRMPSISYAYGLFLNGEMVGCVTYGSPASPRVCDGLCGKEYAKNVLELNRLVLRSNKKNEASFLVGRSLRLLPKPKIIISYADTAQKHVGIVYQATNFIYVGLSAKRSDRIFIDGTTQKHGRHVISTDVQDINERTIIVPRPRKHRYVAFLGSRSEKKSAFNSLKYKTQDYPRKDFDFE